MTEPQYRWPTIRPPSHPQGIKLNKWIIWRDPHCRIQLARCKHTGPTCPGCSEVADHILPADSGGQWFDEHNLRGACGFCNQDRRNHVNTPQPKQKEHW